MTKCEVFSNLTEAAGQLISYEKEVKVPMRDAMSAAEETSPEMIAFTVAFFFAKLLERTIAQISSESARC